jgi:DNA-binding NtrC family response regulator
VRAGAAVPTEVESMGRILVVDDEQRMVVLLTSALEHRGHEVVGVTSGEEALRRVAQEAFDLVLTDLRMDPVDGMAVISGVKETDAGTQVIVLTAYGEVRSAVEALQRGASQYLTKPFNFDEVALVVDKVLDEAKRERHHRALVRASAERGSGRRLVGEAAATVRLRELIAKVAPTEATVLIRGESGSGKELVARAVHAASGRRRGPFVAVNCAAISESLLESELFGYRKGAFTGADADREGLFEAAEGGSLFLDEVGEAGAGVQAKLLRVLEERKLNRVGDPRERDVDVRVIAATNRALDEAIRRGDFREDLYYRLAVFPLDVPALRDRDDDIELLADHFLAALGRTDQTLPAVTRRRLREYVWPGNVRELRNVVERAHILAGAGRIEDEHVLIDTVVRREPPEAAVPDDLNLDNNARRLILAALRRASGNKSRAARLLGITRRTLYSRLKLLGLEDETIGDTGPE